jgi:GlpG protein
MRLIGTIENERKAFVFYSFLLSHGIHSTYEKQRNPETGEEEVSIWIYEEDATEIAVSLLQEFKENPSDPKFANVAFPKAPPQPPDRIAERMEKKPKEEPVPKRVRLRIGPPLSRSKRHYPITFFILALCIFLYIWNATQQFSLLKVDGEIGVRIGMTPIQQKLMFDYPLSNQVVDQLLQEYDLKTFQDLKALPPSEQKKFKAAQEIPTWKGVLPYLMHFLRNKPTDEIVEGPLFVKIKEGQIWRLFTPCLLHGGFLHILFNMLWIWVLMPQVEDRLPKWKLLPFILVVGVVANLAQYLVSGPYFVGISGVVVGLVGFIWIRQRKAPWEGYPLNKLTITFVLVFVGAMFLLEIISLVTTALTAAELSANIANTAHIVGGLVGMALGALPFFSRESA